MRAGQLWSWIYARGATSFEAMSDVSKELRARLAAAYSLDRPQIVSEQVSVDGTRKWLLRLPSRGHEARPPEIETVYIPEADRGTLCISSQIGCTLTCSFCHTGTQRLVRNLEAGRDRRPDPARARPHRRLARRGGARRRRPDPCSKTHASGMTSARSPTSC